MFTGIVQTRLAVADVLKKEDFATFIFDFSDELNYSGQLWEWCW